MNPCRVKGTNSRQIISLAIYNCWGKTKHCADNSKNKIKWNATKKNITNKLVPLDNRKRKVLFPSCYDGSLTHICKK